MDSSISVVLLISTNGRATPAVAEGRDPSLSQSMQPHEPGLTPPLAWRRRLRTIGLAFLFLSFFSSSFGFFAVFHACERRRCHAHTSDCRLGAVRRGG